MDKTVFETFKVGELYTISTPAQREHKVRVVAVTPQRVWVELVNATIPNRIVQWYGGAKVVYKDADDIYHVYGNFSQRFDTVSERNEGVWDVEAIADRAIIEEWWCEGHPIDIIEEQGLTLYLANSPDTMEIWQLRDNQVIQWIGKRR